MTERLKCSPALDTLIQAGVFPRISKERDQLVGCIGCQWLQAIANGKEPKIYGKQIIDCIGLSPRAAYVTLHAMEDAGVAITSEEPGERGHPRTIYGPADTPLGKAFLAALSIPPQCGLKAA